MTSNTLQAFIESKRAELEEMTFSYISPVDGKEETVNGYDVAMGCIATRGANKSNLRTSSPTLKFDIVKRTRYGYTGRYKNYSLLSSAQYKVWRWVAFCVCSSGPNSCLPTTDFFYTPSDMGVMTDEEKAFDAFCQKIVDIVRAFYPIRSQSGLMRWNNLV